MIFKYALKVGTHTPFSSSEWVLRYTVLVVDGWVHFIYFVAIWHVRFVRPAIVYRCGTQKSHFGSFDQINYTIVRCTGTHEEKKTHDHQSDGIMTNCIRYRPTNDHIPTPKKTITAKESKSHHVDSYDGRQCHHSNNICGSIRCNTYFTFDLPLCLLLQVLYAHHHNAGWHGSRRGSEAGTDDLYTIERLWRSFVNDGWKDGIHHYLVPWWPYECGLVPTRKIRSSVTRQSLVDRYHTTTTSMVSLWYQLSSVSPESNVIIIIIIIIIN